MANVNLDASIVALTARGQRSIVFTTALIGYCFFFDSDSDFFYRKTTDGGATWGTLVEIDTDTTITGCAFDVWFDQWTPGDSGTKIHITWFETADGDVNYRALDTNGDTFGSQVIAFNGASAVAGVGAFCSITKDRGGYLYIACDIDGGTEIAFVRSTDNGGSFGSRTNCMESGPTPDWAMLFPANASDTHDIWALYQDASADALSLKVYDDSGNAWTELALFACVEGADLTGQYPFSGAIRHSDGKLIVACVDARDAAGASSHKVVAITADGSTPYAAQTALTNIATNTDDHYYPSVFVDQLTDRIYVAYNGKRDGSETLDTTTNVYYTVSTDGGANWSSGDTAYGQTGAAILQTWAPLMGPRFLVAWRVGTTLVTNIVNSLDLTVPVLSSQAVGSVGAHGGIPVVTTSKAGGTVYHVVVPNGDSPSVAQIKAGQDSNGDAALDADSQAVTAAGVQTFAAVTGLDSLTAYDCWFVHADTTGHDSSAVKADFTTVAAFADIIPDVINGITSAQNEAGGWNAKVKAALLANPSSVVRTSDYVATITLPAVPDCDITAQETITPIVPAVALVGGTGPITATPSFTVDELSTGDQALSGTSPSSVWAAAAIALVAGTVALSGASPAATWTPAGINLGITPIALAGASPATAWTVPDLALAPGSVALSGASATTAWSVPALNLAAGAVALTGTSPAVTWVPAAVELVSAVALTGTSPAATWTASAVDLAPGAVALSGVSPGVTWAGADLNLSPGSVALSGPSAGLTWTGAAINVAPGAVALSGASPASTWGVAAIDLETEGGPRALSGVSASTTWTVAALSLIPGSAALTISAAPVSTWTAPALNLSSTAALSGTAPALTWTGTALDLAPGTAALSGSAPASTWAVPALDLSQAIILTGTSPAMTWVVAPGVTLAQISVAYGQGSYTPIMSAQGSADTLIAARGSYAPTVSAQGSATGTITAYGSVVTTLTADGGPYGD